MAEKEKLNFPADDFRELVKEAEKLIEKVETALEKTSKK